MTTPHRPRTPQPARQGPLLPEPGQPVYDPATDRTGILQAILPAQQLLADRDTAPGPQVAFLRPAGGGVEWLADAEQLRRPGDTPAPPP